MSYVEKNLMPSEAVIYRANLHWAIYMPAIIMGAFSLLMCLMNPIFGIMLIVLLIFPMALSAFVNAKSSEFAVTNKRVMMKFGFIRRTSLEVLLTKVEGITVDQSILGRMFNFGTIVVGGTGGSKTPFPKIADPMRFRREVQEQIEKKSEAVAR
ncbi:MAG: PH domain-containing protein [Opitutaceae bacterium]|nr:PH domain-containing protein [Opitutaceae bacterium]